MFSIKRSSLAQRVNKLYTSVYVYIQTYLLRYDAGIVCERIPFRRAPSNDAVDRGQGQTGPDRVVAPFAGTFRAWFRPNSDVTMPLLIHTEPASKNLNSIYGVEP